MAYSFGAVILAAGQGKMRFEQFWDIFQAKDRRKAGVKAPPQGLFLVNVEY